MRTETPRLRPLRDDELDEEQAALITRFRDSGPVHAITRTFVHHPKLLKAYNVWASHTFSSDNTLTSRESEIVTMRTVWHCKAGYQWSRHVAMGRKAGLCDGEIEALKKPIEEGAWSDREAALIACVDALVADYFIPDELWEKLTAHFSEQQCMDAIFLCGRYVMAAMFLNTAGTPLDPDVDLDPDLDFRPKA